jgi:hypothetical protein
VYWPSSQSTNLTSLLKGAGVDKRGRDSILRGLPGADKTVVKDGAALLRGTWTTLPARWKSWMRGNPPLG